MECAAGACSKKSGSAQKGQVGRFMGAYFLRWCAPFSAWRSLFSISGSPPGVLYESGRYSSAH